MTIYPFEKRTAHLVPLATSSIPCQALSGLRVSGKAGDYLNEAAILYKSGKIGSVHPSERTAEVCRVGKSGAVRGLREGFALNSELDGGHQSEPQDIAPERNADLLGEQMPQTAFRKTGLPGEVKNSKFFCEIFPFQQDNGCLDPRVYSSHDMFRISVKLGNEFFVHITGLPA